jgi:hypothetical protein
MSDSVTDTDRSRDEADHERERWSAPQLVRLDLHGTEGTSAKNPSSFEGSTSYDSGIIS